MATIVRAVVTRRPTPSVVDRYEQLRADRGPSTVPERTIGSNRPIQTKVVRAMADQQKAFASLFDAIRDLRHELMVG